MKRKENWKAPVLHPLPEWACGTETPQISLNGTGWRWSREPEAKFWETGSRTGNWKEIEIPRQTDGGEGEYAFEKMLSIPSDWKTGRIFLRFDGVNCLARIFLDGRPVRSHYGGFVSWDCEITDFVHAGEEHRLIIGVTDKPAEISSFHKGGIIRDVILYRLPELCFSRFHVKTELKNHYRDASLIVTLGMEGGKGETELILTDPDGEKSFLGMVQTEAGKEKEICFEIPSPKKWDSEHPWLYTLTAVLKAQGRETERISRKVGFRQIERRQDQVFVNGDVLKLRGINRHDIHPLQGRSLNHAQVEEDVRLLKEANINFIRTSHYPPRPDFLDLCDRYGIYVEEEASVAFLGYGTKLTQDDPAYRERYLEPFSEMIERDRSHPCVIIWSLGNESYWGENLGACLDYVKQEDPERLTVFSYPLTQMEEDGTTDLWSVHYGNWDSSLDQMTECFRRSLFLGESLPVIHDESTHIPCYGWEALKRDPSIRDFWGETIERFWKKIWQTKGSVGCAVWAAIDDVTIKEGIPQGCLWGILDAWRRKKPEYWHIRKGYSPVAVSGSPFRAAEKTAVKIYNRFNHTNLNEVTVKWEYTGKGGEIKGPDLAPGQEGVLYLPVPYAPEGTLSLVFTDPFGFQVEERRMEQERKEAFLPQPSGNAPDIKENPETLEVYGDGFRLIFSRETGLIAAGYDQERPVITGGPFLHLTGLDLEEWHLETMRAGRTEKYAEIELKGFYGKVGTCFTLYIDGKGLIKTVCRITDMPWPGPRKIAVTSSVISNQGGYEEAGISFLVEKSLDTLTWKRRGQWDVYPDWHIGRLEGVAKKYKTFGKDDPAKRPDWEWKEDERDWALFGKYEAGRRGTRDFRSMKAYIERASLENDRTSLTVFSDGTDSVRMELTPDRLHLISGVDPDVHYYGSWFEKKDRGHSHFGTQMWSAAAGDRCSFTFRGTGIVWYSVLDRICGKADVYVDGILREKGIDLGCSRIGKDPRGYRRHYRYPVFCAEDLPAGEHVIEISVTGEAAADSFNSYVIIDGFWILDGEETGDTRFIINKEFNYPEISWADYCKPPVMADTGFTTTVYMKMGKEEKKL